MNIEETRKFCLNKKGVTEEFPFDEETLVFKVMGKIFLIAPLERIPFQINIKCDPEKAVELREKYESVKPGYHMNKNHWNTVEIDGSISDEEIFKWINDSYELVVKKLKISDRKKLNAI